MTTDTDDEYYDPVFSTGTIYVCNICGASVSMYPLGNLNKHRKWHNDHGH